MEKGMNQDTRINNATDINERETSPLVLAYLGDAYFELLARERLIAKYGLGTAELSQKSKEFVTAISQSAACERLIPVLTAEEEAVFKRGRNAKSNHTPRSAPVADYRRATGLEALFGWLYIRSDHNRARQLFDICFPIKSDNESME
jgi:ribonuclease-3 family protein